MKRKKRVAEIEVFISSGVKVCEACRHLREGEPFVIFHRLDSRGNMSVKGLCWRCCRDAESTLLIKQKWPIAFVRIDQGAFWELLWAPGVKELVGEHAKA